MQDGVCVSREEGTPQGGPLSPLPADLLPDDLDKELEKRGHTFCRYADDCNIYVQSQAAGERVPASVATSPQQELRLRVNRDEGAAAPVVGRKSLGHRLLPGGRLGIAPQSLERAKGRLRRLTRRNRGVSIEQVTGEVNSFPTGWVAYFRRAACKGHPQRLGEWPRRKLRRLRLKRCKRTKPIADFPHRPGVPKWRAWVGALSGKGWWRLSGSPPAMEGMTMAWFESLALVSPAQRYGQLNR